MKYIFVILLIGSLTLVSSENAVAQCSVCTKTSMQLGEKPAQGMNSGILYLMLMPFAIVGFVGYRWWKGNRKLEEQDNNTTS